MLEEMREKNKAAEAAKERNHHDMMKIFQEFHAGSTPMALFNSTDRFFSLKIGFEEFSGGPEDWNT